MNFLPWFSGFRPQAWCPKLLDRVLGCFVKAAETCAELACYSLKSVLSGLWMNKQRSSQSFKDQSKLHGGVAPEAWFTVPSHSKAIHQVEMTCRYRQWGLETQACANKMGMGEVRVENGKRS